MKRNLVKEIILSDNHPDYYTVMDGTGTFNQRKNCAEVIVGGELFYCPYAGIVYKKDVGELKDGEVRDKEIIEKIKKHIK